MDQISKNVNIGSILISLLLGVIGAYLAYKYMDYPLTYSDFIAGSITWGGEGKSKDVSMIFGFIIITSLSLLLISKFRTWIAFQYDLQVDKFFSIVLIYTSVPFVIWLGGQVFSKAVPNYDLLFFNAWIALGGILAVYIILKSHAKEKTSLSINSFILS